MDENKLLKKILGANIRRLRNDKGISQERLAKMVAMSPNGLSYIETGINWAKRETLAKIAYMLQVEPFELLIDVQIKFKKDDFKNLVEIIEKIKDDPLKVKLMLEYARLVNI